jgi:uncharacterized membrane protein
MEENNTQKTVLGISQNLEAVLCYVFGWITGIIFLLLEKENKFVRFHAMQSIVTFLAVLVISMVVGLIPVIGFLATVLIGPLSIILWLYLMYKAYLGEKYKLPWVGDWAEKQVG